MAIKKKHRRSVILGGLLFNPYTRNKRQIQAATADLSGMLDDLDSIGDLEAEDIEGTLTKLIASSHIRGAMDAGRTVGKLPGPGFRQHAFYAAITRAKFATKKIRKTTKTGLKVGSDYALSKQRADMVANYESGRAYFGGMLQGFGDTQEHGKRWVTASENPCEDCQAAEDDGMIAMGEMFSNDLTHPGEGHQNCRCYLEIGLTEG